MNRLMALVCALALAGCANFTGIDPAKPTVVGERVKVEPQVKWASIADPRTGAPMWTVDGFGLDELHFYLGVEAGKPLFRLSGQPSEDLPRYSNTMLANDVMELVVAAMTRAGNLQVRARGLSPAPFGPLQGLKFELAFTNADGLEMLGTAIAAQRGKRLDILIYDAPAEYYFAAHEETVRTLFASVQLVGE